MKTLLISTRKVLITTKVLFAATYIFLSSCEESKDPPALTTDAVTAITQTSATSGGTITSDGGASIESRGLCWGTAANPTTDDNVIIEGSGTGSFTATMTSLSPNTMYYVRAFATNSTGTGYGNQVTFTTEEIPAAALTTTAVTEITATTAVAGGDITSDGGNPVTGRGVCWNTSQDPTVASADGKTEDGSGTGVFTSNLADLTANTTYYLRAYAISSTDTVYGNQVTFTTAPGSNEVLIQNYAFSPSSLTISANTTVRWTNKDGVGHTVTSDTGVFDSGTINTNGTFSYTFTTPGTYPYHCTPHPYMTATIIVN